MSERPSRATVWPAALEWTLIAVGVLLNVVLAQTEISSDGRIRYETLLTLVNDGKISPERYSILQSLLAVPLYYVGNAFGAGERAVGHFNAVVLALTLAGFYALLFRRISPVILRRTILLLLAASMFGHHLQTFYGEVLTACGALLGIAALVADRPRLAGVFMCLAVVNTPVALVGLALTNGLWGLRSRRWLQAAWPVALSLGLVMFEFWWRRGSPFNSGYDGDAGMSTALPTSGQPGFSFPFLFGVLGLTLSFGKGLFFFAPGLVLHLAGYPTDEPATREFARYGSAFLAGLVLVYAKWWAWYGGWYWGPRFLLFGAVPASFALAAHLSLRDSRLSARAVLLPLLAFSAWVGVNGVVFDQYGMGLCRQKNFRLEALCWYTPEFSALFRPFYSHRPLDTFAQTVIGYAAVVVIALGAPRVWPLLRDLARFGRDFVRRPA